VSGGDRRWFRGSTGEKGHMTGDNVIIIIIIIIIII
jgi:hypothetical protein